MTRESEPTLWCVVFGSLEASLSNFSARHSADAPDWQTPADYVEAARQFMGGIDLDPMSDDEAQQRVKATMFYTAETDGFSVPWFGRVFLNPAGGHVNRAWLTLTMSVMVDRFVWVGFSLEQLQTLQQSGASRHPLDYHVCIPNRRIAFIEATARKKQRRKDAARQGGGTFKEKAAPSHGNYLCGFGDTFEAFAAAFHRFGVCRSGGSLAVTDRRTA